jgi:molybdate transport system substrate-binding protein
MRILSKLFAGAVALLLSSGLATAAEIKVVSVGALQVALPRFAAEYTKQTGNTVVFTFTNPATINQTLAGTTFDVIIAPVSTMAELAEGRKVDRASYLPRVSRTGIGIAMKEGAPKPDLSSVEAFKRTITGAKNVLYTNPATVNGSGILTQAILTEVGLLDAVKAKGKQINLAEGKQLLASGEYEMAFFNLSETEAPGVVVAGQIPAPLQRYTTYGAGVFTGSAAKEAGVSFIRLVSAPAAAAIWKASWLEPVN